MQYYYRDHHNDKVPGIPMAMTPAFNMSMPMYSTSPSMMMQNPNMKPQAMPETAGQDPYSYPQNLPMALKLIHDAVTGETGR